jgi:hypothetical protein
MRRKLGRATRRIPREVEEARRRDLAHAALGGIGPAGWDGTVITDDELAEHWRTWAHESHAWGQTGWDKTTYAYWRFIRGLGVDEAIAAVGDEFVRRFGFSAPTALAWAVASRLAPTPGDP